MTHAPFTLAALRRRQRRIEIRIVIIAAAILLLLCLLPGCSANHNLGEVAERPGVEVRGPTLFSPARIKVSSDCSAELTKLEYGADGLKLEGAKFGQSASAVAALDPAVAEAIGAAQSSIAKARGEAIAQGIHASADVIDSLIPILGWLQLGNLTPHENGMQLTLPGGFEIGGKSITGNAELQSTLAQLLTQAQSARSAVSTAQAATSQPAGGP